MIRSVALISLAALAGCGSGGTGPIAGAVIEELGGLLPGDERVEERRTPRQVVTRRAIEAADVAAVWARLESDDTPSLMYAAAENGGYVTYMSSFRQTLTLRGSQITGTRGLGTDLLSARSSASDPLARPVPPASWPARVERTYEFPAEGPRGRIETYSCSFERGDVSEITILEIRYRGVEMSETCTGPAGSFENLHFADAGTGFVWRSLQWVGPKMDLIDLQVLEPYTGD